MKKETITAAAVLCALGAGFLACALHTDQPLSLSERRPAGAAARGFGAGACERKLYVGV